MNGDTAPLSRSICPISTTLQRDHYNGGLPPRPGRPTAVATTPPAPFLDPSSLFGKTLRSELERDDSRGQPVRQHSGCAARDLGAGTPQSLHVRDAHADAQHLHQRRRREHVRGDKRRSRRRQLRVALLRGSLQSSEPPLHRSPLSLPSQPRVRHHGRHLLVSGRPTAAPLDVLGSISSRTSARAGSIGSASHPWNGFATGIGSPVGIQIGFDGNLYYLAAAGGRRVTSRGVRAVIAGSVNHRRRKPAGTFSVSASGHFPSYQWQKAGPRGFSDISGATQSLTIATWCSATAARSTAAKSRTAPGRRPATRRRRS